jgi:hypothetical protein
MDGATHWLNRKRLTVYPRMCLTIFVAASVVWVMLSNHMVDRKGRPLGVDFIIYWSASHIALTGHPADAYSIPLLFRSLKLTVPASNEVFTFFYPPPFYLVISPLALLPYLVAYFVFILSTLAGYVLVFRRITTNATAMWCLAGFSGVFVTAFHGQNGFLTASLAAASLLSLRKRPILAGVFLGLLVIKPHLALFFPVALIAIGAWRTLATAAITATAFTAISTAVLGFDTVRAFVGSLHYARIFLEDGSLPWGKMPATFTLLRLLGTPVPWAYAAHGCVAVTAGVAVWHVWRSSNDWQLRSAALMTATFLGSPYLFDYDLAWLAFPIAWLALIGLRDGWLRGEREILVIAWLLPVLIVPVVRTLHLQMGPLVIAALLWMIVQRTRIAAPMEDETFPVTAGSSALHLPSHGIARQALLATGT